MLKFPVLSSTEDEPRSPGLGLREYIRFSEACRKGNTHVTPHNCIKIRMKEAMTYRPFRILPDAGAGTEKSRTRTNNPP